MHFTVMVFGDDLELQMAPFQETNMGPIAPEYMQKVDVTDEVTERYNDRQEYWRLGDGSYVNFFEAHESDGAGHFTPIADATNVSMSADEARSHGLGFATIDDAAEDLGAKQEGDLYFKEDNYNSRWDSWIVGGRWGSMLKLLPGREGFTERPYEFDPDFARWMGRPPPEAWEPTPGYCDQARKGDIDWAGMRANARATASARWHLVRSWTGGDTWSSYEKVSARIPVDEVREHYFSQSAVKAIREAQLALPPEQRLTGMNDAWLATHDDFVAARETSDFLTGTVLFKGEWHEGDLCMVDAGPLASAWVKEFQAILDQVPDEMLVTIVDCHT